MATRPTVSPEKPTRPARPRRYTLRGWYVARLGSEIAMRHYGAGLALCIAMPASDAAALRDAVRDPRALPDTFHAPGCVMGRDDDGGYSLFAVGRDYAGRSEINFHIPITPASARQLHDALSAALAQPAAQQQVAP